MALRFRKKRNHYLLIGNNHRIWDFILSFCARQWRYFGHGFPNSQANTWALPEMLPLPEDPGEEPRQQNPGKVPRREETLQISLCSSNTKIIQEEIYCTVPTHACIHLCAQAQCTHTNTHTDRVNNCSFRFTVGQGGPK